jgi:hypothetical protein
MHWVFCSIYDHPHMLYECCPGEQRFSLRLIRKTMSPTLQMISARVRLLCLSLGFSIFGMLIIVNQHQADLNDVSGSNSFAMFGGIAAISVGAAFLVAACLHWKFLDLRYGN